MLKKIVAILLSLLGVTIGVPTTYDQRQEGDLNVKVDLDNFVILVARPVSSLDLFGAMAGLLAATDTRNTNVASPIVSSAVDGAANAEVGTSVGSNADEQQSIKDDKEEPRSVVAKENLEETSLQMDDKKSDQLTADQNKPNKAEEKVNSARGLEEVVRTLRNMKEKELRDKERPKDGKYKFVESVEEPKNLKLFGDGEENCGPGRNRDSKGICQKDDSSHQE